eukprot:gene12567-3266_t
MVERAQSKDLKMKYTHLKGLHIPESRNGTHEIHILFGDPTFTDMRTGNCRKGFQGQPIADETLFGWAVHRKRVEVQRSIAPYLEDITLIALHYLMDASSKAVSAQTIAIVMQPSGIEDNFEESERESENCKIMNAKPNPISDVEIKSTATLQELNQRIRVANKETDVAEGPKEARPERQAVRAAKTKIKRITEKEKVYI